MKEIIINNLHEIGVVSRINRPGWRKTKTKVALILDNGEKRIIEIPANVHDCGLAVHYKVRTADEKGNKIGVHYDRWIVSHIKSGLSITHIGWYSKKIQAIRWVEILASLGNFNVCASKIKRQKKAYGAICDQAKKLYAKEFPKSF